MIQIIKQNMALGERGKYMLEYILRLMKNLVILLLVAVACATALFVYHHHFQKSEPVKEVKPPVTQKYWLLLHRKSNIEYLYLGTPGQKEKSRVIKTFPVKSGIPGKNPTPLPQLLGKEYWVIVDKLDSSDNPETAPYFLTLDVPSGGEWPYGPTPYLECGGQCDWLLPGYFGLHGVSGDESRLSEENIGSTGCVRHRDEDITYLYNLIDPQREEVRYYIEDI